MSTHNDPLISLLGDDLRVILLRLFVLNKEEIYIPKEISRTLKKPLSKVRSELNRLERENIVRKKKLSMIEKKEKETKSVNGYIFNKRYKHLQFLTNIIMRTMPSERDFVVKKISKVPGVKLILTTDIFSEKGVRGIEMVVGCTGEKNIVLEQVISDIERNMGRDLCCAIMSVNDIEFRLKTKDKFLSDILELNPTIYLDRLDLLRK